MQNNYTYDTHQIKYKCFECITLDNIFHCNERKFTSNYKEFSHPNILEMTIGPQLQIKKYNSKFVFKNNYNFTEIITKNTVKDNLQIKHYIKIGEECPICYEKILHKSNAYLTKCGHSYHYSCIQHYYDKDYNNIYSCPLCRQKSASNDIKSVYYNSNNILDRLEDFWNNIDKTIPEKCYNYIDKKKINIHNLGMNKHCIECIKYRKNLK